MVNRVISFLFSHGFLYSAFVSSGSSDAIACRGAFDKAAKIAINHDGCKMFAVSQSLQQLQQTIRDGQVFIRMERSLIPETTSHGVPNYTYENGLTESSKNLSFTQRTVVLCLENEKENVHDNTRIRTLTPAEFLDILTRVEATVRDVSADEMFSLLLYFLFFDKS